jgi:hypothetical protein
MSRSRAEELAVQFEERFELDDEVERAVNRLSETFDIPRQPTRRNAIPGVVLGEWVGYNTELYEVD